MPLVTSHAWFEMKEAAMPVLHFGQGVVVFSVAGWSIGCIRRQHDLPNNKNTCTFFAN
jgi:hypothetical protein